MLREWMSQHVPGFVDRMEEHRGNAVLRSARGSNDENRDRIFSASQRTGSTLQPLSPNVLGGASNHEKAKLPSASASTFRAPIVSTSLLSPSPAPHSNPRYERVFSGVSEPKSPAAFTASTSQSFCASVSHGVSTRRGAGQHVYGKDSAQNTPTVDSTEEEEENNKSNSSSSSIENSPLPRPQRWGGNSSDDSEAFSAPGSKGWAVHIPGGNDGVGHVDGSKASTVTTSDGKMHAFELPCLRTSASPSKSQSQSCDAGDASETPVRPGEVARSLLRRSCTAEGPPGANDGSRFGATRARIAVSPSQSKAAPTVIEVSVRAAAPDVPIAPVSRGTISRGSPAERRAAAQNEPTLRSLHLEEMEELSRRGRESRTQSTGTTVASRKSPSSPVARRTPSPSLAMPSRSTASRSTATTNTHASTAYTRASYMDEEPATRALLLQLQFMTEKVSHLESAANVRDSCMKDMENLLKEQRLHLQLLAQEITTTKQELVRERETSAQLREQLEAAHQRSQSSMNGMQAVDACRQPSETMEQRVSTNRRATYKDCEKPWFTEDDLRAATIGSAAPTRSVSWASRVKDDGLVRSLDTTSTGLSHATLSTNIPTRSARELSPQMTTSTISFPSN